MPRRLTTGATRSRTGRTRSPCSRRTARTVAYADEGWVWVVPRPAARRGSWSRRAAPSGSGTTVSSSRSSATMPRASPCVDVDEPWPQRLAPRPHGEARRARRRVGCGRLARRRDGGVRLRRRGSDLQPQRDPGRRRRDRRGAGADRAPADRATRRRPGRPTAARSPSRRERSGWYELHLVDADGSGARTADRAPRRILEARWHPDGTRLVAIRCGGGRFDLVTVDAATRRGDGRRRGRSLGSAALDGGRRDPRHLRGCRHAGRAPARARGRAPDTLHAPAPLAVRAAPHVAPEEVTYTSFDGVEIQAFLFRPGGCVGGAPVPAVVYPHGGPTELLRRRVGRPRAVLRRQGLRVARDQLPRLDRARAATSSG